MKNLVLVIALMMGLSAMAQKTGQEKRHKGDMKSMNSEQMATLQTKRMTLALDLTDAQQKQIQSLNLENATKRAEKMKAMKAKKESGELKEITSEDHYAMKSAMLDHQIAQKEKIRNILSAEQYAKWEKIKKGQDGPRKGKATKSYKGKKKGSRK